MKKKLVFPEEAVVTTLRPDMILQSKSAKTIVVVELTVPWEDRLAVAHKLKKAKYQDLIDEALVRGWHASLFPIDVSCRGFPATSVRHFLQKTGMKPKHLRRGEIASAAEEGSRGLWLTRHRSWNPSAGKG